MSPDPRPGSAAAGARVALAPARVALALALVGCVAWEADADLEGPRVIAASLAGPRTIEVGVAAVQTIAFSEPIDPASLDGAVALVAWEEVGRCDLAPTCDEGSCERGRCQVDPLGSGELGRLDRGDFEGSIAVAWSLGEGPGGPGSLLEIRPREPLGEHGRHSLVIGGALRDRRGAPLVDAEGARSRYRADFVTAGRGSSGPEAELLVPADGELVPRNLAAVVTRFARPVVPGEDARLDLIGDDGRVIALVEPMPCAGWVAGLCLEWRVSAGLDPGLGYRLGGGTIRDREGRAAIPPPAPPRFIAAVDEDRSPPALSAVALVRRGRCVHATYEGDEALRLELWIDGAAPARASGAGRVEVASFLERWPEEPTIDAAIVLVDRAGNHAAELRTIALGEGPEAPPLAIAEVLANPAGPEPAREFVELVDPRRSGEVFAVEGLWIADRSWSEVVAALADGGSIGQALPPFESSPGARVVIVGGAYDVDAASDPGPASGATLLRLDGSIGAGGLSNGGEPLTLFQASPPRLVASMATPWAVQGAADQGRSVVNVDVGGCDREDGWRTHPLGSASPGWAP